jgi:FAD dependent oxidoreductase TIGR03364
MSERYDDAVVGAGIVGLAHAYHLARAGRRVVVFERHPFAQGASIRNFGMLWPIGQPAGEMRDMALRSREIWLAVAREAGFWTRTSGSLHVAYHEDEWQVLAEFTALAREESFECELLDADGVAERSPIVRREGLIGGLWSRHEATVDPRESIARLASWLARGCGVRFEFGTCVTECSPPRIVAGGRTWQAARVWLCSGDDTRTLFPEAFATTDLIRCKLQMMRTPPGATAGAAGIGPMLAAGLTLRHYRSFAACPTLPVLDARFAAELPLYGRFGIHVMVSQHQDGSCTIGDSHEYGDTIEPFDKLSIDELILTYLQRFATLPDQRIAARWHGVYLKHPSQPYVILHPRDGVTAVTGIGGAGMTLSFGLAERIVASAIGTRDVAARV